MTGVNMTDLFIYVFTTEARDRLIEAGFQLAASDDRNGVYTFLRESDAADTSALGDVSYLTGNTFTL